MPCIQRGVCANTVRYYLIKCNHIVTNDRPRKNASVAIAADIMLVVGMCCVVQLSGTRLEVGHAGYISGFTRYCHLVY